MYQERLRKALDETQFQETGHYHGGLEKLVSIFERVKRVEGNVYFIGNGGSAGIAMHMTADYLKNGRMRVISMHNPATLTCLGNDYGIEFVFSSQLELLARSNDLLVAISSSGNSKDILLGIEVAKRCGCQVVTLTGFRADNKARTMGDFNIYVPSMEYGIVESVHQIILQQAVDELMGKNGEVQGK